MQLLSYEVSVSELHDIQRIIKKILLFSSPLLFIFLLNYVVDPFNLNTMVSLPMNKKEIACYFNERLWKLNAFIHNPQPHILLGDSRSTRISEEALYEFTGKKFSNVSLSGATLPEIIDTFWFVVKHSTPHDVTICINFDRFNDWQKANGVHDAIATLDNTLLQYIQPLTCKAAFSLLTELFCNKKVVSQQPPVNRELFWNCQLDEIDRGYQRHVFPLYGSRQLSLIADYCKQHTIDLSFIIFPTHVDLQKRVDVAHLRAQEKAFKQFLADLAPVHDLDVVNEFTCNSDNFDDPKHVRNDAVSYIIKKVWEPKTENK